MEYLYGDNEKWKYLYRNFNNILKRLKHIVMKKALNVYVVKDL